jgi:hypothetical protein
MCETMHNGHTVPAIETLEKMAQALDVPMYALLYDGENPPPAKYSDAESGDGLGQFR